jgi:hypothetical protein
LSTGKMIHSRDVKFRPNSFTHIAALEKGKEAITEVLNTGCVCLFSLFSHMCVSSYASSFPFHMCLMFPVETHGFSLEGEC